MFVIFSSGILVLQLYLPLCWSASEEISATTARQFTQKPPVNLREIGYNGTWEQFCNRTEINKDSPPYLDHTLRILRLEICHRQELNKFSRSSIEIFAEYKYCVLNRSQADELLERLIARFSDNDDEKKAQLFALGVPKFHADCMRLGQGALRIHCIDTDNPYQRMFFTLVTKACPLPWLTLPKIQKILTEECAGNRIPEVDWEPLLASITYTE